MATVTGNFVPVMKDASIKQCIFDEPIDVEGKSVNVDEVVETKIYQSSKDIDIVLKDSEKTEEDGEIIP